MPSSAETGLSAEAGALAVVLRSNDQLVDLSRFSEVGFDAAVDAMADATRSALVSDIKCFVSWCRSRREPVRVVPADPEDIVHYLRWLQAGSKARRPSKPATLDRRVASIARLHRMLGFGDREAFAPTLPLALALLLIRAALSQMDVPTRSSYVMALVTKAERTAAASFTSVPRSLAAAASPALAGVLFAASYRAWPLVLCGALKIIYDLLLLVQFRHLKPPEER